MLVYDLFKVISTDLKRTHVSGTWDLNLSSERWIQYLAAATHQSRSFCRIVWHVSQAHHIGTRVTAAPPGRFRPYRTCYFSPKEPCKVMIRNIGRSW